MRMQRTSPGFESAAARMLASLHPWRCDGSSGSASVVARTSLCKSRCPQCHPNLAGSGQSWSYQPARRRRCDSGSLKCRRLFCGGPGRFSSQLSCVVCSALSQRKQFNDGKTVGNQLWQRRFWFSGINYKRCRRQILMQWQAKFWLVKAWLSVWRQNAVAGCTMRQPPKQEFVLGRCPSSGAGDATSSSGN